MFKFFRKTEQSFYRQYTYRKLLISQLNNLIIQKIAPYGAIFIKKLSFLVKSNVNLSF